VEECEDMTGYIPRQESTANFMCGRRYFQVGLLFSRRVVDSNTDQVSGSDGGQARLKKQAPGRVNARRKMSTSSHGAARSDMGRPTSLGRELGSAVELGAASVELYSCHGSVRRVHRLLAVSRPCRPRESYLDSSNAKEKDLHSSYE
jgi:hypothetical protein